MRIYDTDDEPVIPRPWPVWAMLVWVLVALAFLIAPFMVNAGYEVEIVQKFTVEVVKKPVAPTHKQVAGLHSHRCPYDGTEWRHGEDQFGKAASHACPKCGRIQWTVTQTAPKPTVIAPKVMQSNCPGGTCPVPATRGRRR